MRIFLSLFTFLLLSIGVKAQTNFYKWSAGVNVGATMTSGDAKESKIGIGYAGAIDYYFTPYLNLGFEFQSGKLRGGEMGIDAFDNQYMTIAFNGRAQLGQILNERLLDSFVWRRLKGLYIGAGLGAIQNNVQVNKAAGPRTFKNKEIFLPLNAGLNINIQRRWQEYSLFMVNINYLAAVSFEDGMDGMYDVQSNTKDVYSFLSIGLRFNFGTIGLDGSRRRQ